MKVETEVVSQPAPTEGHPVLAFPGLPFPARGMSSGAHFTPERDGMARKDTPKSECSSFCLE